MRRSFRTRVSFSGWDSQGLHPGLVCDAPLGHGIENAVDDPVTETRSTVWYRKYDRSAVSDTW